MNNQDRWTLRLLHVFQSVIFFFCEIPDKTEPNKINWTTWPNQTKENQTKVNQTEPNHTQPKPIKKNYETKLIQTIQNYNQSNQTNQNQPTKP